MSADPIMMRCEGSLDGGNGLFVRSGVVVTMCKMCGEYIAVTSDGCTIDHDRRDILAMLDRGDFSDGAA